MTPKRGFTAAVGCTGAGVATGVILALTVSSVPESLVNSFSPYAVGFQPTFLGFLRNNLVVLVLIAAGFGVFTGGLLFVIGIPLGVRLFTDPFLYLIVPHGIFEFPSLWLAGAAGFYPVSGFVAHLRGDRDDVLTDREYREFVRLVTAAVGLMIVAAAVETTVTRWLANAVSVVVV